MPCLCCKSWFRFSFLWVSPLFPGCAYCAPISVPSLQSSAQQFAGVGQSNNGDENYFKRFALADTDADPRRTCKEGSHPTDPIRARLPSGLARRWASRWTLRGPSFAEQAVLVHGRLRMLLDIHLQPPRSRLCPSTPTGPSGPRGSRDWSPRCMLSRRMEIVY